ncbi:MAG: DNA methyltransferase [Gemmatimonadales bacterium]|nr:DNA methyltransferase [Gemmatimonadales bacterium]
MPKTANRAPLVDTRVIYCGDCLDQLKGLPDDCVDLVYIDPPFNSNRNYEVFWGETKEKRGFEDRHASTQAYIEYMRPRCVQLARILKRTGSFYYHCDWHASHYVKVMLDQIFGEQGFRNEVVWKRASTVKGNAGQGSKLWSPNTDSIFFYTTGSDYTFNPQFKAYSEEYLTKFYKHADDRGVYRLISMIGPGGAAKGNPYYECMGVSRYWRYSQETMSQLIADGLVVQTKPGAVPQRKQYLEDGKGVSVQTLWDDIEALTATSRERLGYPTQKPLDLLARIIRASSNKGDVVLDAFCGCGTAVIAAQQLGREWIGIDISPTACRVVAQRLKKDCRLPENETQWRRGNGFVVRDLPQSEATLRKMPPFEFENWAVIAIGGLPNRAQVGDMGIDGRIFPASAAPTTKRAQSDFMDVWYPIQVKQKDKAGRPDIDAFEAMMTRTDRTKGFFVAFGFTSDALAEIGAFFRKSGRVIIPLTVREILDDQIAMKLA